jgi:hypothetical protein
MITSLRGVATTNNLGWGEEETTLTDGANVPGGDAFANGNLVEDGLVEDMDKTREETETTLTDGTKDLGGDRGANGSSVDFTNEIVIEKGIAEAVADGGSDDNVFEGGDSNLGQGKDWAMLTDGAKDADANAGDDGSLVDNIETTLADGAKNPAGDTGADDRSVRGIDEIVDKMEMTLTDDCAMSTSGSEGAKESPVNDLDEIGLIFTFEDIETKVCLKEFGSYMKFNNKCLHRGYKWGSGKTYLSAQLFSAPKGRRSTLQNNVAEFEEGTLNKKLFIRAEKHQQGCPKRLEGEIHEEEI